MSVLEIFGTKLVDKNLTCPQQAAKINGAIVNIWKTEKKTFLSNIFYLKQFISKKMGAEVQNTQFQIS